MSSPSFNHSTQAIRTCYIGRIEEHTMSVWNMTTPKLCITKSSLSYIVSAKSDAMKYDLITYCLTKRA